MVGKKQSPKEDITAQVEINWSGLFDVPRTRQIPSFTMAGKDPISEIKEELSKIFHRFAQDRLESSFTRGAFVAEFTSANGHDQLGKPLNMRRFADSYGRALELMEAIKKERPKFNWVAQGPDPNAKKYVDMNATITISAESHQIMEAYILEKQHALDAERMTSRGSKTPPQRQ